MTRVVRRLDLGQLSPALRREDGTIRCDAFITRCGVFNYANPDGTLRRELRLPDDVFNTDSMASFYGVPVTDDHPPEMVDASNARRYAVGSMQGGVCRDDDHLRGRLAIYDGETIGKMDSGRRQVSAGYVCDLDETPGEHPVYGHYDAVQKNIRANHIALVDSARAGASACVRLDAAECFDEWRTDEWSDAAREAAAEARKASAKAKTENTPEAHRAAAAAHEHAVVKKGEDLDKKYGYSPPAKELKDLNAHNIAAGNHRSWAEMAPSGRKDEWSDAAREASAAARAAAGKSGEVANRASVNALSSGKGHDKAAAMHREAAKAFRAAGDKKTAKEHEAQAAEHDKSAKRAERPNVEFQRLRGEFEHKQAAQKFADLKRNSDLSKYVTKKDAAILGLPDSWIGLLISQDDLDACNNRAKMTNMSKARADKAVKEEDPKKQGGSPAMSDPDPEDEASRNERGENDAKPGDKGKKAPGAEAETTDSGKPSMATDDSADDDDDGEDTETEDGLSGHGAEMDSDADGRQGRDKDEDDPDDEDEDNEDPDADEDDEEHDDAYTASYDEGGKLTDEARHKMATTSFGVPDREGLPIHDPDHVRAAMSRFGQFKFKDPEEKHAAFNRIEKRAKQFGVSSDGFSKAHRQTLDKQDKKMNTEKKLREAEKRADAADGEIASLKRDLAVAQKARTDSAAIQKTVQERVDLLAKAMKTGAPVDAAMSPIEIKRAVVKHVDKEDVPTDKPEAYVDALFDGALKRSHKDAVETAAGAEALAEARKVVTENRTTTETKTRNDADVTDIGAATSRARARSAEAWTQAWVPPHDRKENN